jgi:hypothetical protein
MQTLQRVVPLLSLGLFVYSLHRQRLQQSNEHMNTASMVWNSMRGHYPVYPVDALVMRARDPTSDAPLPPVALRRPMLRGIYPFYLNSSYQ